MKLILFLSLSTLAVASPLFFKEKTVKRGSVVEINCDSVGPDRATAKMSALNNCRLLAADYLKQKIKIQNTSIQTDTDSTLHSSVQSEVVVENLNYRILNEACEDSEAQSRCYLRCSFDLSKVSTSIIASEVSDSAKSNGEQEDKNIEARTEPSIKSSRRSFSISTVPQCSSILIEGVKPRVVRCSKNPVSVILEATDRLIVVRANGYKNKSIQAKELLNQNSEEVQFVLSK